MLDELPADLKPLYARMIRQIQQLKHKDPEIQVQPIAVQSKPKIMQDAGGRCGNEEPLYPSH